MTGRRSLDVASAQFGLIFPRRDAGAGDGFIRTIRWLAALPFIAMLVGPFFLNRVTPFVFGMPLLLAWLVAWIVISAAIMAVIFRFDPDNREDAL